MGRDSGLDAVVVHAVPPPGGGVPQAAQPRRTRERRPDSTLVITGTGSGKTESFLYPVLDHPARARAEGHAGVKALLLHSMNALANDQADRGTPLNRKQVWTV